MPIKPFIFWLPRLVAAVLLLCASWWLLKPAPPSVAPVHGAAASKRIETVIKTAPKITVYQSNGLHGEPKFSDDHTHGQARVVDQGTGTTFHSTYQHAVPKTASVTYDAPPQDPIDHLRQQSQRMQQAAQQMRDQQMDRAMYN